MPAMTFEKSQKIPGTWVIIVTMSEGRKISNSTCPWEGAEETLNLQIHWSHDTWKSGPEQGESSTDLVSKHNLRKWSLFVRERQGGRAKLVYIRIPWEDV